MWSEEWNGVFARSLAQQSDEDIPSSLVDLIPFDVSIAMTENTGVDESSLLQIVNVWLNSNFRQSVSELTKQGDAYEFDQIILTQRKFRARRTLRALQATYLVSYEANSVWKQSLPIPDETTVAAIQLEAMLDRSGLEGLLQSADASTGLGSRVVAARATLNREGTSPTQPPVSDDGNSLDMVIIVAIVITVLASCLLIFAIYMAWRTRQADSSSESIQKASQIRSVPTGDPSSPGTSKETSASSKNHTAAPIPTQIEGDDNNYPESVISDDINTSLTAYYQSGMAAHPKSTNRYGSGQLNDAASVSSMESYGYSLDGYASSIAPDNPNKVA